MCDCSTYLAVRRGPRFASAAASQFAFTAARTTRTTDASFFFPLFSSLFLSPTSPHLLVNFSFEQKERRNDGEEPAVVMKARVSPPTGCEVRARINQAAQLRRLYSRNTILLLESVPVGTESRNTMNSYLYLLATSRTS